MQRLAKIIVVLALTFSVGAHWALLQSVAWVGMIVSYSQTASLDVAIGQTFDGKHLCRLCKVVRDGQQSEKKQDTAKAEQKLDLFLPVTVAWQTQPMCVAQPVTIPFSLSLHAERPPVPPPRAA